MSILKVRFHLGKGINYKKWQITSDKKVEYLDPETTNLKLINCKLKNKRNIAEKIFQGQHKTVCAWIECEKIEISSSTEKTYQIFYNPKIAPFWRDQENNDLDDRQFEILCTQGNQVFSSLQPKQVMVE